MKVTHPLVVIGAVLVVLIALAIAFKPKKEPPPEMLQLPAPAGMHDTVVIRPDADKALLSKKIAEIEQREQLFADAVKLAGSTPKIGLSPVVGDLQKQLRANQQFAFPACMQPAKDYWIRYQQAVVDAFFAFMQDGNAADTSMLDGAKIDKRNFEMILESCKGVAEGRP